MKTIDFEEQFGVNAGYVEALYEQWQAHPATVDEEWGRIFTDLGNGVAPLAATPEASSAAPPSEDRDYQQLRGIAARIAANMKASLEVPTATSVRTLPVKVLDENRRIVNAHMRDRALGKTSYTHFIAYAMVRVVREQPNVQSYFEERDGQAFKVTPKRVNIGLAVDVEGRDGGRSLVVPNLKGAEAMNFLEFYHAYQDVIERSRKNALTAEDFAGTTFSLTNPGGIGTEASVPRLMKGQGLILATGAIGVPVHVRGMSAQALADSAIGPVMTVTSTYDHRTVQGAESARLLQRLEALLDGADGFYEEIFKSLRVPWRPARVERDASAASDTRVTDKQARVWQLISAYRTRGCQIADLDPLEYAPDLHPSLDPDWYGFTIWDLDREFFTDGLCGKRVMTLREVLEVLRESYCRRWTAEAMHIVDLERKTWMRERIEPRRNEAVFELEHRKRILSRLVQAENFEQFMHTRYPGTKRFSLEGSDMMLPALAEMLDRLAEDGVKRVVIGMAHRGRLALMGTILGRPYERIFKEFEGVALPEMPEGSGDVKYHVGQRGTYTTPGGGEIEVILTANPSHLEAVDPVVCGMVRAFQDREGDAERRQTVGILVHGDAAFTGQGVVAETLQMSELAGYRTGGTIHLIVNNQIGFTAGPDDCYSTYYCSDLAKAIQAPILHANGDYPEAVLRSTHVAVDYQRQFHSDVVIDLIGYRRRGHNEGDEPAYTQPLLYQRIAKHPSVRQNYIDLLGRRGDMSREETEQIATAYDERLREALEAWRAQGGGKPVTQDDVQPKIFARDDHAADWCEADAPDTGVASETLVSIIDRSNAMPEGFTVHPNLLRQLKRREEMVRGAKDVDWGCAEALALGTLIQDGVGIRLTGQDSQRGTFSHRHAVIRDQKTGADHVPLAGLREGARVEFRSSLLSEEAAVSFEYGYTQAAENTLVAWEAQFGDFGNGAQIPIDQFVAAGHAKWGQTSGLVMLLPHGYDGQGPEHSSARIERWLQMCAEGNLTLANCTTAAQYFHLLRRHVAEGMKHPLIVFTPKSLLRDPRAMSPIGALAAGRFEPLLADASADAKQVKRVILCSGQLGHDLISARDERGRADVAVLRLEQLYPFPRAAIAAAAKRYGKAAWIWAQEEPRNMGAWSFAADRLADGGVRAEYAGRPSAASPATGTYSRHLAEQAGVIERALGGFAG
ncbi:MAG: multifunctional oxoglutarate decarboxylase/oxoglutarate dehydrogenase thiamine pyrophosphate-binding subunit/dihydrolipoyllysine-residue succinyltransferase subunit [Planctomycetota bacterium]|nr:multifunctional oxoglutarate decarboxylase/oxoglutarate dehydrogenase thiamine pyrophosphate-binding subunit/dihydrolipoyllysine-residue succinyltransferase subunit [Planctomycetota bacterium]